MLKSGIVILNYNDYKRTLDNVKRIAPYRNLTKIVVVDNCSTDDSVRQLTKLESEKCKLIVSEENRGYAAGNNIGAKYLIEKVGVDIVFICNPDVEIGECVIDGLLDTFEKNNEYAALSTVHVNIHGKRTYHVSRFDFTTYKKGIAVSFFLIRNLKDKLMKNEIDYSKDIIPVKRLQGSFFGIRSSVFKDIDYFDEGTFLFFEEDTLAAKLSRSGYTCGLVTSLKFKHCHVNAYKGAKNEIRIKKIYLHSKYYYFKKYGNLNKLKDVFLRLVLRYEFCESFVLAYVKNFIRKIKSSY